jgi:hypothetical protein
MLLESKYRPFHPGSRSTTFNLLVSMNAIFISRVRALFYQRLAARKVTLAVAFGRRFSHFRDAPEPFFTLLYRAPILIQV